MDSPLPLVHVSCSLHLVPKAVTWQRNISHAVRPPAYSSSYWAASTLCSGAGAATALVAVSRILRRRSQRMRCDVATANLARGGRAASEEVRRQLLEAEICGNVEELSTSSSTFTLSTDKGECFVKFGTGGSSASRQILEYEAEGLRRLGAASGGLLKVPEPWLVGELGPGRAFIVQEKLELGGRASQSDLGRGLAAIHAAPAPPDWPQFGFPVEGCCGACPQKNNSEGKTMSWVEFWCDYRLGDQLRMLKRNAGGDSAIQTLGAELLSKVPEFFKDLDPDSIKPSLLHGDLWSGNISALRDGTPVIIDPACYYGHYEADHGMNMMFGGGSAFHNASYESQFPRTPGYRERLMLYELHHHLNHYNIFGSGYRGGCVDLMQRVLRT
eukprot:TRINITY_DN48882_c0_g1_i1.p1 TRINITY_DN48882_c0_g1~~TRINITY_DN48882_c0_g1_i1.p1  ORF type:complete len:396 (-),score=70.86 TRINITY_DN48882_c0_g1_i1:29-1183(-)